MDQIIDTTTLTFSQQQMQYLQCIHNLANHINHQQSQDNLQKHYDQQPQNFLMNIFRLIQKYNKINNTTLNNIQAQQSIQLLLLYLKHFIYKQKFRMPNIIAQFALLYDLLRTTKFKSLTVDCFCLYLKKSCHSVFSKDYLHQMARKLVELWQSGTLTNDFLIFFTQILQNLSSDRNNRPCMFIQSERLISMIVNKYSINTPVNINAQISAKTIVILSNYSKTKPSVQFVKRYMCNIGLSINIYFQLIRIFNCMYDRMNNLQTCYNLMQVQLNRLQDMKFINQLDQLYGIQSIQYTCTSILNILKISLPKLSDGTNLHQDINSFMLLQFFVEYKLFCRIVGGIIKLIKKFEGQNYQLCFILGYIIQAYRQELGDQKTMLFLQDMASKIDQEYIFCFLSGVPRSIMEMLQATNILVQNVQNLQKLNIQNLQNSLPKICMFLNFVLHYLSVYHYLEDQRIFPALNSLINKYISMTNIPHIIRCYCLSIGCHLHKFQNMFTQNDNSQNKIEIQKNKMINILSLSFQLLKYSIKDSQSSECIQIITKGLSELSQKTLMRECIIQYFYQVFVKGGLAYTNEEQFIAQIFLKLLQQYFNGSNATKSFQNQFTILSFANNNCKIFSILTYCLKSNNKSLQDQCCEFIVKILWTANSILGREILSTAQHEQTLSYIYDTGVYGYISECFDKQDEDELYCRLLMETILNEKGRKLVQQILNKICTKPDAEKFVHTFDKIWEALVILYGVRNHYTQQRSINSKVDKIMGGSLESLLMNLSIDEKKQYDGRVKQNDKKEKTNFTELPHKKKKIYWSYLPSVRNVLEPGSYVGFKVESVLNQLS